MRDSDERHRDQWHRGSRRRAPRVQKPQNHSKAHQGPHQDGPEHTQGHRGNSKVGMRRRTGRKATIRTGTTSTEGPDAAELQQKHAKTHQDAPEHTPASLREVLERCAHARGLDGNERHRDATAKRSRCGCPGHRFNRLVMSSKLF